MGEEKLLLIFIFFLIILFISVLQIKKVKEREGYFLAGRNLNYFFIFFTILSTSIGSSSTILLFNLISKYGFSGVFLEIGGGLGLIILGLFFSKKLRKTNSFSLPEVLGLKFGKNVRILSSLFVIVAEILWLSLIFKAIQTIVSFEQEILYLLILSFILSISLGGQWAIAKTDVFYGFLIFLSFLLAYFSGNFKSSEVHFYEKMNLGLLMVLFISTFLPHLAGSDIWGKLLSARDEKNARIGTFLAGIGKIFWGFLIYLIVKKFNVLPQGDNTILNFTFSFPKILTFILILGILSALLSSANSLLLTASTVFSNDFLPKFKGRKLLTFILGILSFFMAFFSPDILSLFKKSYGFFSITLSIPAILGLLEFKIEEKNLIILMSLSAIFSLFFPFLPALLISILFYAINFSLKFKGRN